jgi:hypothetical protein
LEKSGAKNFCSFGPMAVKPARAQKQKDFFPLGRAGFVATGPSEQKFFAPLFFKKAVSFLFQPEPIRLSAEFLGW